LNLFFTGAIGSCLESLGIGCLDAPARNNLEIHTVQPTKEAK
jgi:hypothetical protein